MQKDDGEQPCKCEHCIFISQIKHRVTTCCSLSLARVHAQKWPDQNKTKGFVYCPLYLVLYYIIYHCTFVISGQKSLMAKWLEQASQRHEMHCHDLQVMSSNQGRVELKVCSTILS